LVVGSARARSSSRCWQTGSAVRTVGRRLRLGGTRASARCGWATAGGWLRPRRGRCGRCDCTHVLLAATVVPRRRDCTEVIGQALFAAACGAGHRTIAAELDRPPGTVRGWVRACGRSGVAPRRWPAAAGWRWGISLGEEVSCQWPAESPLAYGVEALRWAYTGYVERFGRIADFWELLVALTGGRTTLTGSRAGATLKLGGGDPSLFLRATPRSSPSATWASSSTLSPNTYQRATRVRRNSASSGSTNRHEPLALECSSRPSSWSESIARWAALASIPFA